MVSAVLSSVAPTYPVATFTNKTTHRKEESVDEPINIGNLDQRIESIKASDGGTEYTATLSSSFTTTTSTIVSLSQTFSNIVSQGSTYYVLSDEEGNVIARNGYAATTQQEALFDQWENGTLALDAGSYTVTASAVNGAKLSLTATQQAGTCLQVNSELTSTDTSQFYAFSLNGSNLKLDMAGTNTKALRVIVRNSDGRTIADSEGNLYQKACYKKMISEDGLSRTSGDYTVEVAYAKHADMTQDRKYTMRLFSGDSYSSLYKTEVDAYEGGNSAADSVTEAEDAKLYERSDYNEIDVTVGTALNIGWLKQDRSMLDVYSMLTKADNKNIYSFTLTEGDNLKFAFNSKTTSHQSAIRVQLMNRNGSRIIADSMGTSEQQAAYKELTSSTGLESSKGKYIIKITYADDTNKKDEPYEFGLYSGTTYSAQYKTTASAQTLENAALMRLFGDDSVTAVSLSSYMAAWSSGDDIASLMTNTLKSLV